MDENKASFACFLSKPLMRSAKELPQRYELVGRGGFTDVKDARSIRGDDVRLHGNHEEADTRLILHGSKAVDAGYEKVLVICRDTDIYMTLISQ